MAHAPHAAHCLCAGGDKLMFLNKFNKKIHIYILLSSYLLDLKFELYRYRDFTLMILRKIGASDVIS